MVAGDEESYEVFSRVRKNECESENRLKNALLGGKNKSSARWRVFEAMFRLRRFFQTLLFSELFDPVISARHNGYAANAKHPTDLNVEKLSNTKIDPTGKYVITTRCRTGRSVRGFRLPPVTQFEERRKLENAIVISLLSKSYKYIFLKEFLKFA